MIKFFRRIRQRLLTENKFSKYLLYAIGEIVLVVIGILIALNLNNQNEQRKMEARVELIFEEIMKELALDIKKTDNIMYYWARRDSTIYLVQNQLLADEDYYENKIPFINNLIGFFTSVDLTQNSYDILIQNLERVPPKFKSIVQELDIHYRKWKWAVENNTNQLSELLTEIQSHSRKNHSWYSSFDETEQIKRIDYMLNDFRYRNDVEAYKSKGIFGQLRLSIIYRQSAISCYKKIAELLDKPLDNESFMIDNEISTKLIGDWYDVANPEFIATFFIDDNRLYVKNNFNSGQGEVFYLPRMKKILNDGLEYHSILTENDEIILKHNEYSLKKLD
jgi:hypothetical protein